MTSWNPPTCSINKLSPGGGGRGEGLSHGTQEGGLCGAAVQCQRARGSHGGGTSVKMDGLFDGKSCEKLDD